jgi:hypothetical protein
MILKPIRAELFEAQKPFDDYRKSLWDKLKANGLNIKMPNQ